MAPMTKHIAILAGDHAGQEVMPEAIKVLKIVESYRPELRFILQEHLIGGCAIDETGSALTDNTLEAIKKVDAVLLGAVGGPKWGTGKVRPEQGLLKLRKELGLFGNIRPCSFASESLLQFSPLKPDVARNTNFIILRELIGGVYFGEKTEDDGSGYACDQMPYHRSEIERVARLAAFLAKQSDPPQAVISIDKANVLATSRLWRKTVIDLFEKEFPEIKLSHQLVDSAAMIMVKTPTALNGIVLCENLMGDILSDEASVIPGSLGLLPSASLSAIPGTSDKVAALYEPCHGSAPDIAGQGIVNPVGMILSVALMLKWSFGLTAEAQAIEDAVRKVIDTPDIGGQGLRTKDLGGRTTTKEITEAICATLKTLL